MLMMNAHLSAEVETAILPRFWWRCVVTQLSNGSPSAITHQRRNKSGFGRVGWQSLLQVEPIVRASGDDDQIAGVHFDAHPAIAGVANVEDAFAVDDESHLIQR